MRNILIYLYKKMEKILIFLKGKIMFEVIFLYENAADIILLVFFYIMLIEIHVYLFLVANEFVIIFTGQAIIPWIIAIIKYIYTCYPNLSMVLVNFVLVRVCLYIITFFRR